MKADNVCKDHEDASVGLALKIVEEDDGKPSMVLVEGPASALKFLAQLLNAVADEQEEDSFFISPSGAGSFHFSSTSELGVYIHKTQNKR